MICGSYTGVELPDAGEGLCCEGAAFRGPQGCTCWTAVLDRPQVAPVVDADDRACVAMCGGCAFRPGTDAHLEQAEHGLGLTDSTFYCHQGHAKVVAWVHPSGARVEDPEGGGYPVEIGGRPYDADGQPAPICRGWLDWHPTDTNKETSCKTR